MRRPRRDHREASRVVDDPSLEVEHRLPGQEEAGTQWHSRQDWVKNAGDPVAIDVQLLRLQAVIDRFTLAGSGSNHMARVRWSLPATCRQRQRRWPALRPFPMTAR